MHISDRRQPLKRWSALVVLAVFLVSGVLAGATKAAETQLFPDVSDSSAGGLVFDCPGSMVVTLVVDMNRYLVELGVGRELVFESADPSSGRLQLYLLDKFVGSTNTLDLIHRREFDLKEELVQLPSGNASPRTVVTVSKKEILLALMHTGRKTTFSGDACTVDALRDHIGVRQNTVAWAEAIDWKWPDGGSARWNKKYWDHGNLKPKVSLQLAVFDVFAHPKKYSVGCYTATKLIAVQGILDFYGRVKRDEKTLALIEARLMADADPLSHIEPGAMWYFETGVTPEELHKPGKLVHLVQGVPANNFIPGDWSYFLNTDPATYEKTGYEGSNAIYLGRGKFDDYYNDNSHSYTYKEKVLEVYQWRHHVFSRERDVAKIHPLTAKEIDHLGESPELGGLELSYRAVPYRFGFEPLPLFDE